MTFSIVARDPRSGAIGVATATGGPVVGSLVPHARAGIGAIATQSSTNPHYAFDGLERLRDPDRTASDVLDGLVAGDEGRQTRQCIVIDRYGGTAAWTGEACGDVAASLARDNLAVAGNLLADVAVLDSMVAAFDAAEGELADRLLEALSGGHGRGGDRRGARSAALKVYTTHAYPVVDIRSDWSETPISDLAQILAAVRDPQYADFFDGLSAS